MSGIDKNVFTSVNNGTKKYLEIPLERKDKIFTKSFTQHLYVNGKKHEFYDNIYGFKNDTNLEVDGFYYQDEQITNEIRDALIPIQNYKITKNKFEGKIEGTKGDKFMLFIPYDRNLDEIGRAHV